MNNEGTNWGNLLSSALGTAGSTLQSINNADAAKNNAKSSAALVKIAVIGAIAIAGIVVLTLVFKRN